MTAKKIPFWRDRQIIQIAGQILVLVLVIAAIAYLGNNLVNSFQRLNLTFGFGFLSRSASFGIGNPPISYSPTDPYTRAILVGLINSLIVMFFGIIIALLLGITIGIGRLSDNWLVRQLATVYVETLRNTPLLLQLFFWYFAVFLRLPRIERPVVFGNIIFLTNRGLDLPWLAATARTWLAVGAIALGIISAILFWRRGIKAVEAGVSAAKWWWLIAIAAIATVLVFWFGIDWLIPQFTGNSITGGISLSPELATLLIGLSIYTAAFIAEVVRAGIQSVNKGQWEAARALGLKPNLVMQLVVFPQALRLMIPPLTSEFLNLAKNSSLAIAIGYNDIYAISNTIANQTGKAVEMLLIVMVTYLTINLIISAIMNRFNRAVQLKER
ncbi:amino acid ABC transporter permease [Myxosarcina sp. GI1]|uniref:amino acid ABC transporter permease n=1 Tax=Myxosarcina sp. GI1 TaxID=1541065 RepID=UPI0005643E96|nr:ABC transporter permease subunit [Myxosarcina sp. GI1]